MLGKEEFWFSVQLSYTVTGIYLKLILDLLNSAEVLASDKSDLLYNLYQLLHGRPHSIQTRWEFRHSDFVIIPACITVFFSVGLC
jgi:hypothetical protein